MHDLIDQCFLMDEAMLKKGTCLKTLGLVMALSLQLVKMITYIIYDKSRLIYCQLRNVT